MNITLATGRKSREMKRRLRPEIQLWKKFGGRGGAEWSYRLKSQCHKNENFNSTSRGGVKRKR